MTAPKAISDRLDLITAAVNLQTASTTQGIVYRLLEHWGVSGFLQHTVRVAAFYKKQCELAEKYAHKHLDGLATWVSPSAGMFLYIKLELSKNGQSGVDSEEFIRGKALEQGVLCVPGIVRPLAALLQRS